MKYEVEVQTTRLEHRTVEAASLEEALDLAKAGKGESMNVGECQLKMYARPCNQFSGLDTSRTATGIKSVGAA
jgi:hypothetical protein